jgi:hypothetical protein
MIPFQINPYLVVGAAAWAIYEIARFGVVHTGYRVSIVVPIFLLALIYFVAEATPPSVLSMHDKAFLLRFDLLLFLVTIAYIARTIRRAMEKAV